MKIKIPSHPGDLFYWGVLEPLDLSIGRAAAVLGVRRATLSDLVNGKSSLTAEMAYRMHKAFGISPDMMMRAQAAYDMAQFRGGRAARDIRVKRFHPKAA